MKKEIINALIKNELIDDEIYLDYIEELINKEELSNYVDSIMITTDDLSGFDTKSRVLSFNPDMIIWSPFDKKVPCIDLLVSEKERKTNSIKSANMANIYNLFVIRHEIEHIVQDKIIDSSDDSILKNILMKDTISLMLDTGFFNNFYYKKYHDRFYNEYNANINAYKKVLDELNKLNISDIKRILKKINKVIGNYVLYSYSDIDNINEYSTPIKNMYKINNHLNELCKEHSIKVENTTGYSKFNIEEKPSTESLKLMYGLAIKPDTYKTIRKVSNGRIKTLNLFNEIKN